MKIGLALSGGGIKSFCQIPILESMDHDSVPVDIIAGTSMGSAIAAIAACKPDIKAIRPLALDIESRLEKSKVFSKPSLKVLPFAKDRIHAGYVDGQIIEDILDPVFESLGVVSIRDVKIPLAIPAVDIHTGKIIVFVSHPDQFIAHPDWEVISDVKLSKAVRASCSFPFVIAACPYDPYMLIDGGVKMNLPLELIEAYGATKKIAVTMHQRQPFDEIGAIMPLVNRVMDLMADAADAPIIPRADLHLNVPLDDIWVFDIGRGLDTINAGQQLLPQFSTDLLKLLEKQTLWQRLRKNKKA